MLSYDEAVQQIEQNTSILRKARVPLDDALGLVLASDVKAPEPFPSFDNSAVDGYAIPNVEGGSFRIQGEIRAGDRPQQRIKPNHAFRIFTGAPVPAGTAAIVMQEDTRCEGNTVHLTDRVKPRANVRFRGEDFQKGKVVLSAGCQLDPQHLALLAALGIISVPAIPTPRVSILATGSELVAPSQRPRPGQIRASNPILLASMLGQLGAQATVLRTVGDSPAAIRRQLERGLASDMLLISGGISVGKYDHVREVLRSLGVREIFWKVDIKPGKPVYFGKAGRTLVFALPGNPVSVFVTFEEFVRPALVKMMGREPELSTSGTMAHPPTVRPQRVVRGALTSEFRNGSRLHFVRVRCVFEQSQWLASPLTGQGSHMLGALAQSNGILKVAPNAHLRKGQPVEVKLV
jgi:molybdopterin molybdotransferase